MSKTVVIWVVTVGVVLALLGLLSVSSHSARWPVDSLARFTGGAETGRPPAESEQSPGEPVPAGTLTR